MYLKSIDTILVATSILILALAVVYCTDALIAEMDRTVMLVLPYREKESGKHNSYYSEGLKPTSAVNNTQSNSK